MRYLICRLDGVRPHGKMRTSEHFPMIYETDPNGPIMTYEDIVRAAMSEVGEYHGSRNYIGYHDYLVVPLIEDTKIVSFLKPHNYEVHVRDY